MFLKSDSFLTAKVVAGVRAYCPVKSRQVLTIRVRQVDNRGIALEFDFDIRVPKHKEQDDDPVQDYAGITDAARIAKLIGQHRREQLIDAAGTREAGKDVKSSAAIERLERALAEREKLHNEKLHENQTAAAQLEGRLKVAYA